MTLAEGAPRDGDGLSPAIRARRWTLDRLGPVGRGLRSAQARRRRSALEPSAIDERMDRLGAQVAETKALLPERMHEIIERLDRLGAEVVATKAAVAELERRTRNAQALTARFYEQAQGWPDKLTALRESAGYEAPYGPEPLVSVNIPTYNRAETLCDRALASVRRQTYEHWEVIVVGDRCTDDTEERIRAIGDPRIRFENLPFRGPYPEDPHNLWQVAGVFASNRAAELSRGDWIACLDDDDEWADDHLEVLLAHAHRTHAEVVYGQWRIRDARNGRLVASAHGLWPVMEGHFTFQCAIFHSGLRGLPFDPNGWLAGEPGDLNRARRLWDAGVRFAFLERPVSVIWFTPRFAAAADWLARLVDDNGYVDDDG